MSVSVSLTSRLAWLLGALVLSLVWIRTWTRRLHNALLDLLNKVAHEETKNLPHYMKVCTVSYLSQAGDLVAIPFKKELEDQDEDFRIIPGFEFVFESNGAMYYRNRRTLASDQTMGEVVLDITRVEMGILTRLTEGAHCRKLSVCVESWTAYRPCSARRTTGPGPT